MKYSIYVRNMGLQYKKTVLVVDDDPGMLCAMEDSLEMRGYRIYTACCGEEAINKAVMLKPDLIILDISMPGKSGFEVLSELKKISSTRRIPVFILSVNDHKKDIEKGFLLGAVKYIIKPCSIKKLDMMISGI